MYTCIILTLKLSLCTAFFLIVFSLLISLLLNNIKNNIVRSIIESFIFLPLILPPTVLGFYLLFFLKYLSFIFSIDFCFTFSGLFIGSVIYSLPFALQPLSNIFFLANDTLLKAALSLKSTKCVYFFFVYLPSIKNVIFISFIFSFAHTLGEFGVVLMVGGNILYETKVFSITIFEFVESLQYFKAHVYSFFMVVFSFILLFFISKFNAFQQRFK